MARSFKPGHTFTYRVTKTTRMLLCSIAYRNLSVNMSKSSKIAMVGPPLSMFSFGATVAPRSLRIRTSFTTSLTLRRLKKWKVVRRSEFLIIFFSLAMEKGRATPKAQSSRAAYTMVNFYMTSILLTQKLHTNI